MEVRLKPDATAPLPAFRIPHSVMSFRRVSEAQSCRLGHRLCRVSFRANDVHGAEFQRALFRCWRGGGEYGEEHNDKKASQGSP